MELSAVGARIVTRICLSELYDGKNTAGDGHDLVRFDGCASEMAPEQWLGKFMRLCVIIIKWDGVLGGCMFREGLPKHALFPHRGSINLL